MGSSHLNLSVDMRLDS